MVAGGVSGVNQPTRRCRGSTSASPPGGPPRAASGVRRATTSRSPLTREIGAVDIHELAQLRRVRDGIERHDEPAKRLLQRGLVDQAVVDEDEARQRGAHLLGVGRVGETRGGSSAGELLGAKGLAVVVGQLKVGKVTDSPATTNACGELGAYAPGPPSLYPR